MEEWQLEDHAHTVVLFSCYQLGDLVHSIPTVGFNVETVEFHNLNFTVWDVGGQHKIRRLWKHYFPGTQGIIFVVDSCDCNRLDEAAHELHMLLSNEDLDGAAVVVLANKQDMPGALSAQAIGERLGLQRLRNRQWYIQACSALQNRGLYEGLDWLGAALRKSKKSPSYNVNY